MRKLFIISTIIFSSCAFEKSNEEKSSTKIDGEKTEECVYVRGNSDYKKSKNYKNTQYIEVRSYEVAFEGAEYEYEPTESDSIRRDPRENYVEKIILNKEQTDSLFQLLVGFNKKMEIDVADCYMPRHMIAFFNNENQMISHIDICFECGQMVFAIPEFRYLCGGQLTYYKNFLKWCGLTKGFRN